MTNITGRYRLSFTSASSQLPIFAVLAGLAIQNGYNIDDLHPNQMGKEKRSTNIRQLRELKYRLQMLTRGEIDLLANGDLLNQKHIILLAICKTYRFVFDFIVEVLREKALVYDYEIRESDYNSFINRKTFDHPELERLTELSRTKIRTVLYRMLSEAGLINNAKSKVIQQILLSGKLERLIADDNPELLKIFLKPDREIARIINDN